MCPAMGMGESLKENRDSVTRSRRDEIGAGKKNNKTSELLCPLDDPLDHQLKAEISQPDSPWFSPLHIDSQSMIFSSGKCQRHYDTLGHQIAVPFWNLDRIPVEMTSSSCEFADTVSFNTHAKSSSRFPQLQGKERMCQPNPWQELIALGRGLLLLLLGEVPSCVWPLSCSFLFCWPHGNHHYLD